MNVSFWHPLHYNAGLGDKILVTPKSDNNKDFFIEAAEQLRWLK